MISEDLRRGGDGTTNWNKDQRQKILEEYAEEHHINSVKNHPSDQSTRLCITEISTTKRPAK
ncbi:hypothetical protein SAMN05428961_11333 [Paenibacillus sp. OK060]|nr:hypothetical protein SAMN05428961_11333 [Paenibacillus sp. OK060]